MTRFQILGALLAGLAVALPQGAVAAEEPWPTYRRGDGYSYYRESRSSRPAHGYEGFAGPPMRARYCSYRRIPNRACDDRGCRVKSWTLEQFCY